MVKSGKTIYIYGSQPGKKIELICKLRRLARGVYTWTVGAWSVRMHREEQREIMDSMR